MKKLVFSLVLFTSLVSTAAWWDITPTSTDDTAVPNKEWVRDYVRTNMTGEVVIPDEIIDAITNDQYRLKFKDPLVNKDGVVSVRDPKPGWAAYSGFIVNYQRDYELSGEWSSETNKSAGIIYRSLSGNATLSNEYDLYPLSMNRIGFFDDPTNVEYVTESSIAVILGNKLEARDDGRVVIQTTANDQKITTIVSAYSHPLSGNYLVYDTDTYRLRKLINDGALSALMIGATTSTFNLDNNVIQVEDSNCIKINERQMITLTNVETNQFYYSGTHYYIIDNTDLEEWMKNHSYSASSYKYCNGMRILTVDKDIPGESVEFTKWDFYESTLLGNPKGSELSPVYWGDGPDTYVPDGNVIVMTQGKYVYPFKYLKNIRNDLLSYYGIKNNRSNGTDSKSYGRPIYARVEGHTVLVSLYYTPYSGVNLKVLFDAIKEFAEFYGYTIAEYSYVEPDVEE